MGLAVLPSRLKTELAQIKDCLINDKALPEELDIHKNWVETLRQKSYKDIDTFINDEVTKEFMYCLEDAGVFKQTKDSQKAFDKFIGGFVDDYSSKSES